MPRQTPAKTPFPLLAAALRRYANELGEKATHLEETGHRIGLSPLIVKRHVDEMRDEAMMIGEVYGIIVGLVPVENTIRAGLEITIVP